MPRKSEIQRLQIEREEKAGWNKGGEETEASAAAGAKW